MDVRPSRRGLAGIGTAVLISLPMQHGRDPVPPPSPAPTAAPAVGASGEASGAVSLPPLLAGTFIATVKTWDTTAADERIGHARAASLLLDAGVRWKSTGDCGDRRRPYCTSLEAIRYGTLMRTIDLRRDSGCPVTVTGGTEAGHADGRYSHGNGYKVDLAHNRCLDAYVTRTYRYWRTRGDGAALYRPPSSDPDPDRDPQAGPDEWFAVWADEPTHWDVLFR
ncbi:hypothetical protein [Microbispora siamensis]|uniref:Peptidase M15B domain-containing protein n=1 Tax=Microbispora siamensis TaxID=564413 RepID=A0ABQ4GU23_9ACTN|nr:hypothetical protein [Microbispora siamensis]GIH64905.1 hypothetical protein Msi02_57220 [Microbispora siamensis]